MKTALYSIAVACLILIFVGGPGQHLPRPAIQLWNFGHVPAFAVWALLLLPYLRRVAPSSVTRQFLLLLLAVMLLGIGTETIQANIKGRTASFTDLLRDLTGGVAAFAFFNPELKVLSRIRLQALRITAIIMTAVALVPTALALTDELIARTQFPVIADFETTLERSRWQDNGRIRIDQSKARHGKASLEIKLGGEQFSGAKLLHFPRDWSSFSFLKFEVLNQAAESLVISCRLHDRSHNNQYNDRYQRSFSLKPGWNSISIPLLAVKNGPEGRELQLTELSEFEIFAANLPHAYKINIDYLRLTP